MARRKANDKQATDENIGGAGGVENKPSVQADNNSIAIGGISIGGDLSGEVNVAGRDIIKNINTIHQRALTVAEEAARGRELERKLLAQGIGTLVQSLSAQASEGTQSDTPYKGLLSYSLNEAEIFYGRNEAKKDLLNCLKQGSLTVLHAKSGAGKTSLLQAGIAAQLIANGHLGIHLRSHDTNPIDFIKRMFLPELAQVPALAAASLREFLRQVCTVLGAKVNLYLLLDQFEEFFNLLKKGERQPFLDPLADCLNDPGLKVRWVLALRADSLSDLAELEAFGITPFKNMYRLNRLSRLEAREAIIEPAKRYGVQFEPALIEHILDTLTTNDEVMPTHLQLVCSALTDDLPEDKTLTLIDYTEQEGGTEGILRDYLKRQLDHLPREEQALAWKVLRALITADRQRTVKTHDEIIDEVKVSGVSKKQIDTILARLVERQLLFTQPAPLETFELAHDYLVKEIELDPQEQARKAAQELLEQETRNYIRFKTLLTTERLSLIQPYLSLLRPLKPDSEELIVASEDSIRRELEREQNRVRSRNRLVMAFGVVVLGLGTLALIFGLSAMNSGRQMQQKASIVVGQQLLAQARSMSNRQLDLALLLSLEANRLLGTWEAKGNLIDMLQARPEIQRYLYKSTRPIKRVTYSLDGKLIGICCDPITILDARSGAVIWETTVEEAEDIAISPNSRILAVAAGDQGILLWDLSTHQRVGEPLTDPDFGMDKVAFSPDGTKIASTRFNDIMIWDLTNGQLQHTLEGHYGKVTDLAFSSDGKLIASSSESVMSESAAESILAGNEDLSAITAREPSRIIVWDVATGKSLLLFPIPVDEAVSVAFTTDDSRLVTGHQSGALTEWNIAKDKQAGEPVPVSHAAVNSLALNKTRKLLIVGSEDGSIYFVNDTTLETQQEFAYFLPANSVTVSPDGQYLVSGSSDGGVIEWNLENRRLFGHPLIGQNTAVMALAFAPEVPLLASGDASGTIQLWDPVSGLSKSILGKVGTQAVTSLAIDEEGKLLISGDASGKVLKWDLTTEESQQLVTHPDRVTAVAISNDGENIASSSYTATNSVILNGQPLYWMEKIENMGDLGRVFPTGGVAFMPNSNRLISAGVISIDFWDIRTMTLLENHLIDDSRLRYGIIGISLSHKGDILIARHGDGYVTIWNLSGAQPRMQQVIPPMASKTLMSIALSPDDTLVAASYSDNVIRLWDVSTAQLVSEITDPSAKVIDNIAFNSQTMELASGNSDGTIVMWTLQFEQLQRMACEIVGRDLTEVEWDQYLFGQTYHPTCSSIQR